MTDENWRKRPRTHGHCVGGHAGTSPTYKIWASMIGRCHVPSSTGYQYYGGKGIAVCARWHSFENFLADMGERPPGLTIEREDNSKDYSPDNCSWATWQQQQLNRRKPASTQLSAAQVKCVRMIGWQKTAASIASIYGVSKKVIDDIRSNRTWKDLTIA